MAELQLKAQSSNPGTARKKIQHEGCFEKILYMHILSYTVLENTEQTNMKFAVKMLISIA